jgi:hypothetical protein
VISDEVRSELARIALVDGSLLQIEAVHEVWAERAAIREYLGGFSRDQAEHLAVVDTCEIYGIPYRTREP